MTIVRRASPLGELISLRQAMDRTTDGSSTNGSNGSNGSSTFATGEPSGKTTAQAGA